MNGMVLIGGPYDGAEGQHTHAGRQRLWVRVDPERRARNGLVVGLRPAKGMSPYRLVDYDDEGRFVYAPADTPLAATLDQEALHA